MLVVHSSDRANGDSRALVHNARIQDQDECWDISKIQNGQYTLTKSKVRI